MVPFFDHIKHLNDKAKYTIESDLDEKEYQPFLVNKGLSFIKECVPYANVMNQFYTLDKIIQYDFYFYGIPKGKRYSKWIKKEEVSDNLKIISEYFGINKIKAQTYLNLLNADQIEMIKVLMNKGGR